MPVLEDLRFPEVLFKITTGNENLTDDLCSKHIWWHEMYYQEEDGGLIGKNIYNAYNESITLQTQSIDYSRISDIE
jgi:hypothetical protein